MSEKGPLTSALGLPALSLLYASVIWGWSFPVTKDLFQFIDPISFTAYSFILSGLGVLLIEYFWHGVHFSFRWKEGLALGVLLVLVELPQAIGLGESSSQNTAFISNSGLLFLPFLGWILMRDRLYLRHLYALAICAIGLYLITGGVSALVVGDAWLFLAALFMPIFLAYSAKFEREGSSDLMMLTAQQFILAGLVSLVFIPDYSAIINMPGDAWTSFLMITFLATFLPYFFVQWAERRVHMVTATFIYALEPVFGGLFAWTLGGESVTALKVCGAFLVLLALLISQLHTRHVAEYVKARYQ